MSQTSLNQALARSLAALMRGRWNNTSLGTKAGLAPNTIRNYLQADTPEFTPTKGAEKSATLTNVQKLADALGVHPLALLLDVQDPGEVATSLLAILAARGAITKSMDSGNK
jgi:hypothetical protein